MYVVAVRDDNVQYAKLTLDRRMGGTYRQGLELVARLAGAPREIPLLKVWARENFPCAPIVTSVDADTIVSAFAGHWRWTGLI